jgi:glycerol kinase
MKRGVLWATVDQGSTSTKGALISTRGESVLETRVSVRRDVSGDSVVHDPKALAGGVVRVLDRLLAQAPENSVAGIGLTCQRSTCLLWDRESGEALTEALSWQDRTQARRAARLVRHQHIIRRRTGLPLSPHYAALKLSHLLQRVPGGVGRARNGEIVAGTLDAFLVRRLVGRDYTEPGHAGRTLCFHLDRGEFDRDLCRLFGVPRAALPTIVPSASVRGSYRDIPLTAVAGDQQAALLGHGGWRDGVTAAHFGTGAFILAATGNRPRRGAQILSAALATTSRARRYQAEGSVNSAGSAVDWIFGITKSRIQDWGERNSEPDALPAVLPAFAGLATPWWRPGARAVYAAINQRTSADDLVAGTLFALAMRVLDCVDALARAGVTTRVLRVSGKLTRLSGLITLLANAGQIQVEVSELEETGLAGIARLAAAGAIGNSRPLEHRPRSQYRLSPQWPAARAAKTRRRWRTFVRRTLEIAEFEPF